jgi:hypothetical protein
VCGRRWRGSYRRRTGRTTAPPAPLSTLRRRPSAERTVRDHTLTPLRSRGDKVWFPPESRTAAREPKTALCDGGRSVSEMGTGKKMGLDKSQRRTKRKGGYQTVKIAALYADNLRIPRLPVEYRHLADPHIRPLFLTETAGRGGRGPSKNST